MTQGACPGSSAVRVAGATLIALMAAGSSSGDLSSTGTRKDANTSESSDARARESADNGTTSSHDGSPSTDVGDDGPYHRRRWVPPQAHLPKSPWRLAIVRGTSRREPVTSIAG